MEPFRVEIRSLTARLEASRPLPGSTEEKVLDLLLDLGTAAGRLQDARLLNPRLRALEDFWLHSVPWCSVLSKEIEKILILYEEWLASA